MTLESGPAIRAQAMGETRRKATLRRHPLSFRFDRMWDSAARFLPKKTHTKKLLNFRFSVTSVAIVNLFTGQNQAGHI
jgi:hypothetical protein